ncbi:hypothetical protein ACIGO9_29910 [Nocardia asteroides]|uniref:hypothetical protein n=1 Tax=Nocardia asteroides TaxID=1824 RepID=UPI0037C917CD
MGMHKPMSAKEAVRIAEQYVTETIAMLDQGRSDVLFVDVIDQLRENFTRGGAEGAREAKILLAELAAEMGPEEASFIAVVVRTAEAARLWRRHHVVYRVHPGLAESLFDTDTRATVPCEVFARLPHPDPFVVFPEPIPAPASRPTATMQAMGVAVAEAPVFVGMRITGMTEHEQLCSTSDPRMRMLDIALATRIRYEGLAPSYEESTLVVPVTGSYSIDDLVDYIAELDAFGEITRDEQQRVFGTALSLLLYLCSDKRDCRAYEPPPGRKGKKRRPDRRSGTVLDLGFDVGPALQSARRAATEYSGRGGPGTGVTVRAHLRRAHWHTYWTGPRSEPVATVRWLHPILVGTSGGRTRPTVIDVGPPVSI